MSHRGLIVLNVRVFGKGQAAEIKKPPAEKEDQAGEAWQG
jgi:hypothetical protein